MLVYPTLAVIQAQEWNLPLPDLLILTFPGFLLYGLVAIPVGIWADKRGGWEPLTAGLIGMGLGSVVCGQATNPTEMTVGLAIIGLFAGAYHPAGMGLITQGIERSSWALGINGMYGAGAVAVAPGLAEILCHWIGWSQTFYLLAVVPLILGVVFLFMPIKLPKSTVDPEDLFAAKTSIGSLWTPGFLLLCAAMTVNGIAYRGNTVVLPSLMDDRVPFIGHGIATSITYGFAMVMNYLVGRLAEKFSPQGIYVVFIALSLPPLVATAWLSEIPLLIVASMYGACALGLQPAENTLVAHFSPPAVRSRAYGIKFTLTFGIGALAAPLVSTLLASADLATVQLTLSGFWALFLAVAVVLKSRFNSGQISTGKITS